MNTIFKNKTKSLNSKILLSIFIIIIVSSLFSIFAFAATADDYINAVGGVWTSALGKFTFKCYYWVYGGLYESVSSSSYFLIDTSASYWAGFTSIYDVLSTTGILLALLWVLLDLLEKAQFDNLTPEILVRFFIKFIIAMMLIQNAPDLMTKIIDIGNYLMQQVVSGATGGSATGLNPNMLDVADEISKASFLKCIGRLLELIVPFIFTIIGIVLMYVLIFGRILELGVRFMFTPIGIADVFTHGISSPGMRYIKKFGAVALQGAVMVAILIAGTRLAQEVNAGGVIEGLDFFVQIIVLLSMLGAMMKSQQVANDIMGV